MTEEDLPFDIRKIPEINQKQQEQKTTKRNYGNKYLKDRHSISIENNIFNSLDEIKKKRNIKTMGELFTYLVEVEKISDVTPITKYECKKCHKEIDVPKNVNLDRLVHNDLYNDVPCKGSIKSRLSIVKTEQSGTNEAKDKQSGTNEAKDKQSGTKDAKSELEEKQEELTQQKTIKRAQYTEKEIMALTDDEYDRLARTEL